MTYANTYQLSAPAAGLHEIHWINGRHGQSNRSRLGLGSHHENTSRLRRIGVRSKRIVLVASSESRQNVRMTHIGPHVTLDDPAFIHDSALIYGKVHLAPGSSVWPYVVMRAEMHEIRIGERTNIQDFVMIHVGNTTPTIVGADCSITHHVTLHGCEIGDRCLIGINATLMDGVKLSANSIVAGHSILREGSEFPENSIVAGVPAKLVGTRDNGSANLFNAAFYYQNALNYAQGIDRMSPENLQSLFTNPKAETGEASP
jgi:carbonic anhydrase/acetyltransferase-like protein (isoleucine patch superfamily)